MVEECPFFRGHIKNFRDSFGRRVDIPNFIEVAQQHNITMHLHHLPHHQELLRLPDV